MEKSSNLSLKTKKILTGIAIAFGTIVVFLVSFTLSFCLIINPISLFSFNSSDAAKENAELKEKVQSLNDEIDHLNASVDRYRAAASENVSVPAVTITPDTSASKPSAEDNTSSKNPGLDTDDSSLVQTDSNFENEADSKFSPETVTGTAEETPEDIEAPITVIDISEN